MLLVLILRAWSRGRLRRLQDSGLYPPAGRGTDSDVERLMREGQKIMAIKLYRELHHVDLKTAKEAVEALARNSPPR